MKHQPHENEERRQEVRSSDDVRNRFGIDRMNSEEERSDEGRQARREQATHEDANEDREDSGGAQK